MRHLLAILLTVLALPALADDEPIVEELFLTEAPWAQGRGDVQLTGVFAHAQHGDGVAAFAEYGVTDRLELDLEFSRDLPDVGKRESEVEIGALWAVRPDLRHTAVALGASLAQVTEDGSLTLFGSLGHTAGPGVVVADVVVPLIDGADASAHAGYVHPLGALRLLAEAEVLFADDAAFTLAPGVAWKPSETLELGAALVVPLQSDDDLGVIAQATLEF